MLPTVYCLIGPTASGKTDLAIRLLQEYPCEIISVDSAMIYRGMNIGTAKPTAELLKTAPHRLIDIRDPSETYSAGEFCEDAHREINDILAHQKIPLLVGGTMLYFNALQQGLATLPRADKILRAALLAEGEKHGWPTMHERLKKIDPVAAMRISPQDKQRIQRSLEVYELTGKTQTQLLTETPTRNTSYNFINIALIPQDRTLLHEKIERRFDQMLELGFENEVKTLFQRNDLHRNLSSIRSVGYRQLWDYLAGEYDHNTMRAKAIAATRQLAKRQITWLRGWNNLQIVPSEDPAAIDAIALK